MEAEKFIQEMLCFFRKEFPEFILFIPPIGGRKSFAFFAHYPQAGVSIVVYPSIRFVCGQKQFVSKKLKVLFLWTETKEWIFGLKHCYRKKWKKGIRARIIALKTLIQDVKPCEKCGSLPNIQRKFTKKDKKNTKFVSFFCVNCREYKTTTFGTRLKTNLHQLLK